MTARRAARIDALLVFGVVGAAYALRLDNSPLNGTEALRAVPALEMLRTGDWIVPRLWGAPYLAKPPMFPWLLALASWISGSAAEWVFRLPSALAMGATGAAVCVANNRWFGRPAGLIGGLSTLLMAGLWSQALKADIDAAHTLAVTVAALGLLCAPMRAATVVWTGLAIGAAMLLKGPACLPVVIGAIIGRAIGARSWRTLGDWRPCASLLIGAALFGAWAFAAYRSLAAGPDSFDWRGAQEVASRITASGAAAIGKSLLAPLLVLLAAAPLPLLVHLAAQRVTTGALPPGSARLLHSALATIGVALALFVLARTTNARYAYIVLPLFGVIAGAVGKVWLEGRYERTPSMALRGVLAIALVALLAALAVFTFRRPLGASAWATLAVGAVAGGWAGLALARGRHAGAMIALAVLAVVAIGPYAAVKSAYRHRESPLAAALAVREAAGAEPILTDAWMVTGPAVFHYADAAPRWKAGALSTPGALAPGTWVQFQEDEWAAWSANGSAQFDRVIVLPIHGRAPVLARVGPGGISPAPGSAARPETAADR